MDIQEQLARIETYTLLAAKNVLTLDDVVLLTGLAKSYVYKLTHHRQIPYYRPNGKQIYFDRKEVEDWLKQNRVNSDTEAEQAAVAYVMRKGGRK